MSRLDQHNSRSTIRKPEPPASSDVGHSSLNTNNGGISAIIITHNRREILQGNIRRLLRSREKIDEIILVDNGSTDGTAEMIAGEFPDFHLIRLPGNLGIPQARNIGALNAKNELLLFLDDDGTLDCPCLPQLARFLCEDKRLAVVACNVIEGKDGGTQPGGPRLEGQDLKESRNVRGPEDIKVPPGQENRATSFLSGGEAPTLQPTYTFCGGAAMLKRSAFIAAGMFPGHFFYSHEEDDLSFRLIAKGYRLALCPEAIFTHCRPTKKGPSSRKRIFYYYRNRQYVIWRNLPRWVAIRESFFTLVGGAVRTIFTSCFPAFLAGSAAGLARLIGITRNERLPLSQDQYRQYRKLGQGRMKYRHRLRNLLMDISEGKKLDWI